MLRIKRTAAILTAFLIMFCLTAQAEEAGKLIPVKAVYRPNMENKAVYDRNYQVFRRLYKSNAKHFKALNEI